MGLILDTSAVIALERGASLPATALERIADEPVWMPAIVWAEALIGVRLAGSAAKAARRRARLAEIRDITAIIDFDDHIAEHYADIFYECSKSGHPLPQNDIAVAATARARDAAVLVGPADESHFRRVKNLKVVVLK